MPAHMNHRFWPTVGHNPDPPHLRRRACRRAARKLIAAYQDEQLRALLERMRDGFTILDAGEIDAFDLDELIHRYKRSAHELSKFCGSEHADDALPSPKPSRSRCPPLPVGCRR